MKYMADDFQYTRVNVNGVWTCAKPLEYWSFSRFQEAWDVFIGKALAVYFRDKNETN